MRKMKNLPVEKIRPSDEKKVYQVLGYQIVVAGMGFVGSILALWRIWNLKGISMLPVCLIALSGIVCAILSQSIGIKYWLGRFFWILPWPVMFLLTGGRGYLQGAQIFANQIIERWNQLHDDSGVWFQVEVTQSAVMAFSLLLMLACAQVLWLTVSRRNLLGNAVYGISWTFLMLVGDTFSPGAAGLMIAGLFGVWLSERGSGDRADIRVSFNVRTLIWCLLTMVILGLCVPIGYGRQLTSVQNLREAAKQELHEMRYGKDVLPQGDLRKADTLQKNPSSMLRVTSEQGKTLYLKGFVGGVYESGEWKKMSNARYSGDYAGMMKWLYSKNFDPLTQVSDYYTLSRKNGEKDIPDENKVDIQTTNASRYYMYTPSTLKNVTGTKTRKKKDMWVAPGTFVGKNHYAMTETSSATPAELTVAKSWISQPKTGAQTTYTEAEAVYREFVYSNYLSIDKDTRNWMNELFWKDYKSDNDGIYSALCQIREVLAEKMEYTEHPENAPQDEDPIQWFLQKSKKGNSMLYASVAVEAFRAHGIPARYVEGYYVGVDDLEKGKTWTAELTGESAHAWAEVYFDGIGWLPVDVSPGYYYDAVELQKMVGKPNTAGRKSNLNNNSYNANEVTDTGQGGGGKKRQAAKTVLNIVGGVLGIFALAVIILTLGLAVAEMIRLIRKHRREMQYEQASMEERALLLEKKMYAILKLFGIEACLGWSTAAIEEELEALSCEEIRKGDYSRCCEILEKGIYGGMPMELYEERTLLAYMDNLVQASSHADWHTRLKIHYMM